MEKRVNIMSKITEPETSGLYQCPNCESFYTFGAEAIALINKCLTNESRVSRGIARCQCGESTLFGGEDDGGSILIFGEDLRNKDKHEDLPIIDNLMLTEASEDDPEEVVVTSTYDPETGRTIRLKLI